MFILPPVPRTGVQLDLHHHQLKPRPKHLIQEHHRSSGGFKRSVTQRVRSSPIQTNEETLVHTSRLSLCRLACIKDGVWFSPWPNLQSLTFLSEFHHQFSSVTIQNPFSSVGWHYRCMSQTCWIRQGQFRGSTRGWDSKHFKVSIKIVQKWGMLLRVDIPTRVSHFIGFKYCLVTR